MAHIDRLRVAAVVPISVTILMSTAVVSIALVAIFAPGDSVTIGTLIAFVSLVVTQLLTLIKVFHVEHQTNSMKDELVEATRKGAFAAGQKDEQDNPEQQRKKEQ